MHSVIKIIRNAIPLFKKNYPNYFVNVCKASRHTLESKSVNFNKNIFNLHDKKDFATTFNDDSVEFIKDDNNIKKYPYIWLRDHCKCSMCFNSVTEELELDISEISLDIKPILVKSLNDNSFEILCECFYLPVILDYDGTILRLIREKFSLFVFFLNNFWKKYPSFHSFLFKQWCVYFIKVPYA